MILSPSFSPPQQEHVQLRRRSKGTGFKPATLVVAMVGTLTGLSLVVMLYLGAQALQEPDGPKYVTTTIKTKKLGDEDWTVKSVTTTELTKTPEIGTADDMEGLFNAYHQNPAAGSEAIFTGTSYCAEKAVTDQPCLLWLPVDTPDTKRQPPSASSFLPLQTAALQTWKGKKEIVQVVDNQDRSVMIFYDAVQGFGGGVGQASLLLLADGHGPSGHGVAEQVVSDLPVRILQGLEAATAEALANSNNQFTQEAEIVQQVMKKAFLETDEIVLRDFDIDGGSTVVLALHWGENLYLVSAGDSTGALAEWNGSQAVVIEQAVKHKPGDAPEKARIEAAGGEVVFPPGDPSSRVIIPSKRGPLFDSALAMSRCMGDIDGKTPGFLIADPAVKVIPLQPYAGKQLMVLISSDGVTDFFPIDNLLKRLGSALFSTNNNGQQESLQDAVEASLEIASRQWKMRAGGYRDDMSLLVARVST